MSSRVITLIDMDCFYVQVEERENPVIRGTPAAVVQYNAWKGGGIIAVNYEARAKGVTRQMRGQEAKEKCPGINLVTVPVHRDKADLTKYRLASKEVMQVLLKFGGVVERASIDEAYIDLTTVVEARIKAQSISPSLLELGNTWVVGEEGEREQGVKSWLREIEGEGAEEIRLAVGAAIVEEIRAQVYQETQFRCSAGIASCKTLAKLCCGLNKPNKQTVLPIAALSHLYNTLPVTKVRGLGGKLGELVVHQLNCKTMGELSSISLKDLIRLFEEKTGTWLHELGRGRDNEMVVERDLPKSIGASKNFSAKDNLNNKEKVKARLRKLAEELVERLEKDREEHGRVARGLTVGGVMEEAGHSSRSGPLHSYELEKVFKEAYSLLSKLNTASGDGEEWTPRLVNISVSAAKFEEISANNTKSISAFFKKVERSEEISGVVNEEVSVKKYSEDNSNSSWSRNVASEQVGKPILSFFAKKALDHKPEDLVKDNCSGHEQLPSNLVLKEMGESFSVSSTSVANKGSISGFFKMKESQLEIDGTKNENTSKCLDNISPEELITTKNTSNIKEKQSMRTSNDGTETSSIDIKELIPSLENYDPSLLQLLPHALRDKARDWVKNLQNQQKRDKGIAKFFDGNRQGAKVLAQVCENSNSPASSENKYPNIDLELVSCEKCAKLISPFELPEHLDYHFAMEIQSTQRPAVAQSGGLVRNTEKRKLDNRGEGGNKKRKSDITSFFNKS